MSAADPPADSHPDPLDAEARATFTRLTETMRNPAIAGDEEARGSLREAEALLQEKKAP
jgi:hypothetical protein